MIEDDQMAPVRRMLRDGLSREAVAADLVLDPGTVHQQARVIALGLHDPEEPDAVPRWVRTELLHAIGFGKTWGAMDEDEMRQEFEAALREAFRLG
ncbi:hypothetical protein [Roseomonas sp. BN140053]|uniref:hypothetical protein n=1 Tax=Roseomonas sp. BN140053 TaxID=3391898 RepID=UPI0039ECA35F